MIRFHNAQENVALSYATITSGPGPLVDPVLVAELRKVKNQNSSLRAENKFLWLVAGINTVIVTVYVGLPAVMDWLAMV